MTLSRSRQPIPATVAPISNQRPNVAIKWLQYVTHALPEARESSLPSGLTQCIRIDVESEVRAAKSPLRRTDIFRKSEVHVRDRRGGIPDNDLPPEMLRKEAEEMISAGLGIY